MEKKPQFIQKLRLFPVSYTHLDVYKRQAFVIILPSRHTQGKFKNNYGIFSSGITSIIQAIARQRNRGEIHIILPRPNEFNYESLQSLMSQKQIKIFKDFYEQIKHHFLRKEEEIVNYIPCLLYTSRCV